MTSNRASRESGGVTWYRAPFWIKHTHTPALLHLSTKLCFFPSAFPQVATLWTQARDEINFLKSKHEGVMILEKNDFGRFEWARKIFEFFELRDVPFRKKDIWFIRWGSLLYYTYGDIFCLNHLSSYLRRVRIVCRHQIWQFLIKHTEETYTWHSTTSTKR